MSNTCTQITPTHTPHTHTFKANENTQTDNYNGKPNANKQ